MTNRKQEIEELMESFTALRRNMAFRDVGPEKMPRITPSQWGVLMLIEQRGGTSVKEVAGALHISSSAATQLIDGLVTSGYVERETSAEDRRTVKLTLSKKSKNQVETMRKKMVQKFLNMFEVLTDVEFDQYLALNKKMVQNLLSKKDIR